MKLTATGPALAAALLLALLAPPAARAQTTSPLAFTLMPSDQTGAPGSTLHFTGTLSNTTGTAIFLNGDSNTLNAPGLTLDDSPFLSAPTSLAPVGQPGSTYTGGFFDILIAPSAMSGVFSGSFTILGGADGSANDAQASQTFSVTVGTPSPVPEASTTVSLGLLLLGLGGVAVSAKRKKQARLLL